jgi:hypothetical protein
MRAQPDKTSAADHTEEVWKLIMRIAEPTDLLHTILNGSPARAGQNGPAEMHTASGHCIVLHGCTITINHPAAVTPEATV